MYKYNVGFSLKYLLKSETAQAGTDYTLLIFMLLAVILALKVFSAVMNVVFAKAAGRIVGAV